jgi:glutamate dehydrogenase
LSPDLERDGWATDRSLLMFVTDDVPFLVDTVRMVLDRYRLGIHLLVHPMLSVSCATTGRIVELGPADGGSKRGPRSSLDRCTEETAAAARTRGHLGDRRCPVVVSDFAAMRASAQRRRRRRPLLEWLADEHFIFLGSAIYRREGSELVLEPGSELGEYRTGASMRP